MAWLRVLSKFHKYMPFLEHHITHVYSHKLYLHTVNLILGAPNHIYLHQLMLIITPCQIVAFMHAFNLNHIMCKFV